jgi:hypothetical protein
VKPTPFSLKSLSLAVLLLATASARADVRVYTDRTAYLAALSASGTDTFNDLAIAETPSPLSRLAGPFSYQASSGPVSDFWPAGTPSDVWLATTSANDTITFGSFSGGVRGFGGNFFGSDVNGAFSPGRTMILSATDGTTTRTVNLYNTTTTTFLGFISSDPLATVTLHGDGLPGGTAYWASANDVTLGVAAVPEPESYGMLLAGLGLVGFAMRRRAG